VTGEDFLAYAPTVLSWAAVAYRTGAAWRSQPAPGQRALWLTLLCVALALTVLLAPLYLAFDRVLGVPNLARLVGHGFVVGAAWSVQVFLNALTYPAPVARTRNRQAALLFVVALSGLGFLFAHAPVAQESLDFTGTYAQAPYVLEYRLLFSAYLGWALGVVAVLCWRYASLSRGRAMLSSGLRLVSVGALVGIAYIVNQALWAITGRLGVADPLVNPQLLNEVLIAVAITCMVSGATLPAWGPRLGLPGLPRWWSQYRALRQLFPLWRGISMTFPEIALLPPPRSGLHDALAVGQVGRRLRRRVVEIRDGRLALRPYLPAGSADDARHACGRANLSSEDAAPVIEAACLAAALRARIENQTVRTPGAMPPIPTSTNVESESAFLVRVAWAYQRSPIVRAVRDQRGLRDGEGAAYQYAQTR